MFFVCNNFSDNKISIPQESLLFLLSCGKSPIYETSRSQRNTFLTSLTALLEPLRRSSGSQRPLILVNRDWRTDAFAWTGHTRQ